jgi:hypothetical protein
VAFYRRKTCLRLFDFGLQSVSHVSGRELRAVLLQKNVNGSAGSCGLRIATTRFSNGNTWFAQIQLTANRRWLVGDLCLTKGSRFLYQESTVLPGHLACVVGCSWRMSVVRHEDSEQAHRK